MSGFLWRYLDHLPRVPEELIQNYMTVDTGNESVITFDDPRRGKYQANFIPRGDPTRRNTIYHRLTVDDRLEQWLRTNIIDCATDYGMSYNFSDEYPVDHNPHVDYTREYVMMYNIDNGGDEVYTDFYIDRNSPLEHPQGTRIQKYDDLILLDRVNIELHRWIIINAKIIHGVSNITRPRINLQLGLKAGDPYTN